MENVPREKVLEGNVEVGVYSRGENEISVCGGEPLYSGGENDRGRRSQVGESV